MDPKTKMVRSRINLLLDEPFFGSLLLNLQPIMDAGIGTMATDGRRLIWSPDMVTKLSEAEIKTVLAHEALHCALLHQLRRGERDPKQWNVACDYAVNLVLEDCNKAAEAKSKTKPFAWPKDYPALLDRKYAGMSAEEIYNALPRGGSGGDGSGDGSGNGQQPSSGKPGMGDVQDDPGKDPAEASQQEANWKQALVQAAMASKNRGTMPASIAKMIEDLLNPKASWQEILRRFICDRAQDDYSWTRPNPRYAHTGFILPSLHSQRLGTIGIIRDTSGSTQDWQTEILSELAGIISQTKPSRVIVIDCDSRVQRVLELDSTDPLPQDAIGGGGTAFEPALEKMAEYDPVCCVYLTDLAGSFPDVPPAFPVLWATAERDGQAPFGEVISI